MYHSEIDKLIPLHNYISGSLCIPSLAINPIVQANYIILEELTHKPFHAQQQTNPGTHYTDNTPPNHP
jgi:hypothetical protein